MGIEGKKGGINMWPQIIVLSLFGISLLVNAYEHGKPRKPTNFWIVLAAIGIEVLLLYWGGFFAGFFD